MNSKPRGWIPELAQAKKPHTWREYGLEMFRLMLGQKASDEDQRRNELSRGSGELFLSETNHESEKTSRLGRHSWKLGCRFLPMLSPNPSHSPGQPSCRALRVRNLVARRATGWEITRWPSAPETVAKETGARLRDHLILVSRGPASNLRGRGYVGDARKGRG